MKYMESSIEEIFSKKKERRNMFFWTIYRRNNWSLLFLLEH
jgi:hypothetical protein